MQSRSYWGQFNRYETLEVLILANANLSGAQLVLSNLDNANLEGADLRGANLYQC